MLQRGWDKPNASSFTLLLPTASRSGRLPGRRTGHTAVTKKVAMMNNSSSNSTQKLKCMKYSLMVINSFGVLLGFFIVLFGLAYPTVNFPGGYKGKETAMFAGVFIFFSLIGYCGVCFSDHSFSLINVHLMSVRRHTRRSSSWPLMRWRSFLECCITFLTGSRQKETVWIQSLSP